MSRQTQGLRLEHKIAKEIANATGNTVLPLRAGFSGNQSVPSPDLLIPYKGSLRAVEMKSSSQKRLTVSPEDVEDIFEWADTMTEMPTYPYLSVKFPYYEMYTGRLHYPKDAERSFERWAEEAPFDTNITRSGNLTIGHPSEYDCEATSSQKSPGDGLAVLRDLHLDEDASHATYRDTVTVYDVLREHPDYWDFKK